MCLFLVEDKQLVFLVLAKVKQLVRLFLAKDKQIVFLVLAKVN